MNRHERRAAKVMKRETMTRAEYDAMGNLCAWEGCMETYEGDMPEGWRNMWLHWTPRPVLHVREIPGKTWDRDSTLCPKHARELDSQLKDLGRWAHGPVAGQA